MFSNISKIMCILSEVRESFTRKQIAYYEKETAGNKNPPVLIRQLDLENMFSISHCFVFACKFSPAFTSLPKGPSHPFHCGVVTTGANERVFMGLPSFSGLLLTRREFQTSGRPSWAHSESYGHG